MVFGGGCAFPCSWERPTLTVEFFLVGESMGSKEIRRVTVTLAAAWFVSMTAAAASATSQTTAGTIDLYSGASKLGSYSTLSLCEAAARDAGTAAASSGQYTCRTAWTVNVTYVPDAPPPSSGQVSGSYSVSPTSVSLSGATAVAHWPGYSPSAIGNFSGGTTLYENDPRTVDGSRSGLYKTASQFTFTVTGSSTVQTLKVYVGGSNSGATFSVSQGGQVVYTDTRARTSTQWDAVYTVTFSGQISVTWAQSGPTGNVTIQAAALYGGQGGTTTTGNVGLSWTTPTTNSDGSSLSDLAGFYIYRGNSSSSLSRYVEIDGATAQSFNDLNVPAGTWFYAMSSFNASGGESARTQPVSKTIQ